MCCLKNAISIGEQTYLKLGNNFYYFCCIILVFTALQATHKGNGKIFVNIWKEENPNYNFPGFFIQEK